MRRFPRLSIGKQSISVLRGIRTAFLLAMALAVCYHGYRLYASMSGLRATESSIAQMNKTIGDLSSEQAASAGLSTAIMPVEPPLDSGKFMSTFIRQITDLSVRTGCKLSSIKPKLIEVAVDPNAPNKDAIKYKPIEVSIDMLADYRGANDFIAGLSKLPKVVKVTQIDLSRRSVDCTTRHALLDVKLTLVLCMLEPGGKTT